MLTNAVKRIESKTKDSQFVQILKSEFEFSPRTARAVLETARETYNLDKIDPTLLGQKGEVVRSVISREAKHGPPLKELPMVEVVLTLLEGREDEMIGRRQGEKALRQRRILRMTEECREQGGSLTQEDLADVLKVSPRTIRRDIKELKGTGFTVFTRGITHDIGPSISHKTMIVNLYLEGKTYTQISRISRHSPDSIKRYIKNFGQVTFLHNKGLTVKGIAYSIGISVKLVKEYLELYLKYNTPEYRDRIIDLSTIVSPQGLIKEGSKKGARI